MKTKTYNTRHSDTSKADYNQHLPIYPVTHSRIPTSVFVGRSIFKTFGWLVELILGCNFFGVWLWFAGLQYCVREDCSGTKKSVQIVEWYGRDVTCGFADRYFPLTGYILVTCFVDMWSASTSFTTFCLMNGLKQPLLSPR